MTEKSTPRIINYDDKGGASYRTDFWEGKGRDYEDRVERIALERLLNPRTGQRLLELGAGFGRLSSFFAGYEKVILVDYAKTQLEEARANLGDEKYIYIAADIYRLPIADGACDAASMIRVLHHFVDSQAALKGIRQTLSPGAVFVLEYANKRNLKAMLRYALSQQKWSPYAEEPVEFVELNFDFHPNYIHKIMQHLDFDVAQRLAVSYFRLGIFKQTIPTSILTQLDALLQSSGWLYSPSIFTENHVPGQRPSTLPDQFLKCPACHSTHLSEADEIVTCGGCQTQWSKANGIYDFREPINHS